MRDIIEPTSKVRAFLHHQVLQRLQSCGPESPPPKARRRDPADDASLTRTCNNDDDNCDYDDEQLVPDDAVSLDCLTYDSVSGARSPPTATSTSTNHLHASTAAAVHDSDGFEDFGQTPPSQVLPRYELLENGEIQQHGAALFANLTPVMTPDVLPPTTASSDHDVVEQDDSELLDSGLYSEEASTGDLECPLGDVIDDDIEQLLRKVTTFYIEFCSRYDLRAYVIYG